MIGNRRVADSGFTQGRQILLASLALKWTHRLGSSMRKSICMFSSMFNFGLNVANFLVVHGTRLFLNSRGGRIVTADQAFLKAPSEFISARSSPWHGLDTVDIMDFIPYHLDGGSHIHLLFPPEVGFTQGGFGTRSLGL